MYNTPTTLVQTRLFWLDFIRNIFAPLFKSQSAVTSIAKFDLEQPVLLTNDLQLVLPSQLETVVYYATNLTTPRKFSIDVSYTAVFVFSLLLLISLLVVSIAQKNGKFHNTFFERAIRLKAL